MSDRGRAAVAIGLAAYGLWLIDMRGIRAFFDEHDARGLGVALVVVIAAAAGAATMSAPRPIARNVLVVACWLGTVAAMVRDSGWRPESPLVESTAFTAGVLASVLVSVQRWSPRFVAALVLAVLAAWTLVGFLNPYPHALIDAEQSWSILGSAAVAAHLALGRPQVRAAAA